MRHTFPVLLRATIALRLVCVGEYASDMRGPTSLTGNCGPFGEAHGFGLGWGLARIHYADLVFVCGRQPSVNPGVSDKTSVNG
jgi:hypothetical protein